MKDILRVAVIGAGMFGKFHALYMHENPRAELVWICSRTLESAELLAQEFSAKGTASLQDVLGDPTVDALIVATPPWLHYETTMAALTAGKHVLSEKPLGINPQQADELVAYAQNQGLILADCSARHSRLNPKFRMVREMVRQKKFGDIYFIKYTYRVKRDRYGLEYHPAAKWALDKSKAGGGPTQEWGVYDLSFIYGLFNDQLNLKDAMAFGFHGIDEIDPKTPIFDTEEHLGAFLQFDNGLNVMWEVATACHGAPKSQIEIFGSRGGLTGSPLTWDPCNFIYHDDGPDGPRDTPLDVPGIDEHNNDLPLIDYDFVNAILDGNEPAMSGRHAAQILKTIDRIYRSAGIR